MRIKLTEKINYWILSDFGFAALENGTKILSNPFSIFASILDKSNRLAIFQPKSKLLFLTPLSC
jgi:hypothetical protein